MPATKKDKARKKHETGGKADGTTRSKPAGRAAKKTRDPQPAAAVRGEAPEVADEPTTVRASTDRVSVKARSAAQRIRGLADRSESLDVRRRLRQLARQIAQGGRDVQGISFCEGLLSECLDDAAASAHEQWLACEAITWGLAWLARTRRAGGSAGGLLERLVKQARVAQTALKSRDTAAAPFVVALARLFRDIEACRCLEQDAVAALEEEIGRLVSADGVVSLAGVPVAGSAAVVERVVRWTTAREIAATAGKANLWNEATEKSWTASVSMALRLLGTDGRILTAGGALPAIFSEPLLVAAAAVGKSRMRRTAATLHKQTQRRRPDAPKGLLPRDLHSADAAAAIIRTGWEPDSVRVMLEYRQATPRLEIAVGDRLLIDGAWQWRVSLGGRPLEAEGPWKLSCFESDRKSTFLEITAALAGGLQFERQVVVLRRDRVVLLADAVTRAAGDPPSGALASESVVPLASSLETERADETREIFVYDTAMRLAAMPLALPEWSVATAPGGFESSADGLTLRHESAGSRLYSPLWLDCDPSRFGRPLTWRQLTVADTRQNLPRHQAAGFRVQAGLEQWLLYRALDEPRNRTVLGCNLSCEFLMGRIRPDGSVGRTLEIQ